MITFHTNLVFLSKKSLLRLHFFIVSVLVLLYETNLCRYGVADTRELTFNSFFLVANASRKNVIRTDTPSEHYWMVEKLPVPVWYFSCYHLLVMTSTASSEIKFNSLIHLTLYLKFSIPLSFYKIRNKLKLKAKRHYIVNNKYPRF